MPMTPLQTKGIVRPGPHRGVGVITETSIVALMAEQLCTIGKRTGVLEKESNFLVSQDGSFR